MIFVSFLFLLGTVDAKFYPGPLFPKCFGLICRNNGTVNKDSCMCDCPPDRAGFECELDAYSEWPDDDFALPETVFGCPEPFTASWRQLEVNLIIQDDFMPEGRQYWPELPHLRGPFHNRKVTFNFCVKQRHQKGVTDDSWPPGQYCIYKQHPCPQAMNGDEITLPGYKIDFTSTTLDWVQFISVKTDSVRLSVCCRSTQEKLKAISLPKSKPFVLFKASGSEGCQPVEGTEVRQEWFAFLAGRNQSGDMSIGPLSLSRDHGLANLSYCFYKNYGNLTALDYYTTYRKLINGRSGTKLLFTPENTGGIIIAQNVITIRTTEQATEEGLTGHRTGFHVYHGVKYEDLNIQPSSRKITAANGSPHIDKIYHVYDNVALNRPVSTNAEKTDPSGAADGFLQKGFIHFNSQNTYQPWVRIDLGAIYLVHAVLLDRDICISNFKWLNIAAWIHERPYQFQSLGGHLCSEVEDLPDICTIDLRCLQPMTGYYVTIQAYASAQIGYKQAIDTSIRFSEIQVFGEATECGQYFGIGKGKLENFQVDVGIKTATELYPLNHPVGLLVKENLLIEIDLLAPNTVEALALNFTTNKTLTVVIRHTQPDIPESSRQEEMVVSTATNNKEQLKIKYFRRKIFTRFLQLMFINSDPDDNIYINFDLIGCPKMHLRDPLCQNKKNISGMSEEYGVSASNPGFTSEAATKEECRQACFRTNIYHAFDFSLQNKRCRVHVGTNAGLQVRTQDMIFGEKICLEGVIASPCFFELDFSDRLYVASPRYPAPYPRDMKCVWKINLKNAQNGIPAVKITFLDLKIPKPNGHISQFEQDSCVDFLSVDTLFKRKDFQPELLLTYNNATSFEHSVLYMMKIEYLHIQFVSCMRNYTGLQSGFVLKVENSDCVGCQITHKTCKNRDPQQFTSCSTASHCGYLSNLGINRTDTICRWMYESKYAMKLEILHFDVPSDEKDCRSGNFTLYSSIMKGVPDFSKRDLWKLLGVFCNSKRPKTVWYMNTDFGVEFATGHKFGGTGFLLRWKKLKHKMQTSNTPTLKAFRMRIIGYSCGKTLPRYTLYEEYPYKCYFRFLANNPITWIEAERKCKKIGGKLATISNKQEDYIMRSLAENYLINNIFIGVQRNHSTGQLYDTDGNRYVYMNWGYDTDLMSVEPNGFDLNNCIVMKDIADSSGFSLNSKWADVNCYEMFEALIICEKPSSAYGLCVLSQAKPKARNAVCENPAFFQRNDSVKDDFKMTRDGFPMTRTNLFLCNNGEYILRELRCDTEKHCLDASDELNCDYTVCRPDRFYCGNDEPRCIDVNLTCDFINDCHNGADETECVFPACGIDQWRCQNGQCVPKSSRNDNAYDCADKSDELGSEWGISIHSRAILLADNDISDDFIQVYSENGRSRNIYLDRDVYDVVEGYTISYDTQINMTNPFKIRLTHYAADVSSRWYIDSVTLYSVAYGTFTFHCDCKIPDPNKDWIPYHDISVNSGETELPLLDIITYTIQLRTGEKLESMTANKVYIALYGETSDTGTFELRHPSGDNNKTFEAGSVDVFTYETVDIGDIRMVKLFTFGVHIEDLWYLEDITIQTSKSSQPVILVVKSWMKNMITVDDMQNGVSLFQIDNNRIYSLKNRVCSENMFQCLDGNCIPKSYYCDTTVHCHGPFHEDEPLSCLPNHFWSSCREALVNSHFKEDYYNIVFSNINRQYDLHCSSGSGDFNGKVVSKVDHNQDYWQAVTGLSQQTVQYFVDDRGIDLLKQKSEFCIQRIEVGCINSHPYDVGKVFVEDNHRKSFQPFTVRASHCQQNGCNCRIELRTFLQMRYREFQWEEVSIEKLGILPIRRIIFKESTNPKAKIRLRLHPLECFESLSDDEKLICKNGERYDPTFHCVFEFDTSSVLTGCRDFSHLTECDTFECPTGYVKCHSGYCIPLHYVCNGMFDCLDDEDEQDCNENNTCIGSLRCRNSTVCVASGHICNEVANCPLKDDELFCKNSTEIVRSLTAVNAMHFDNNSFHGYKLLASLNLASIGISRITKNLFQGLRNLITLDLRNNDITGLAENVFGSLSRLKSLNLEGNTDISRIEQGTFRGLDSLEELELRNMKISVVFTGNFEGLGSLKTLNLSNNRISILQKHAFSGLNKLKKLDLRGNDITEFSKEVFSGLDSLEHLVSDLFLLCCLKPKSVPDSQCFPLRDEISSCDDLMRNEVLRVFVWIIGLMALFGNAFALLYRFLQEKASFKTGNGVLLTNLCFADFLMGVYMVIIGSADSHFRGKYISNDGSWRNGVMCKLAGFLSFLSSEVSGVFLCLITIDRFVTIRYTLKRMGFTRNGAFLTCLLFWVVCIVLALAPLVGIPYFDKRFYTKSGVCLAHPLTREKRGGWEYATAIFVFWNFFMFIFIAVGQFLIFREIHKVHLAIKCKERDDVAIARKLSLVVMTNFLCWFPICIMGLIAMSNIVINSDVYAWVAVFVIPLNSATNPIVYTLSSKFTNDISGKLKRRFSQKRKTAFSDEGRAEKLKHLYDKGILTIDKQRRWITLDQYLDGFTVRQSDLATITKALAKAFDYIHTLGYVVGHFTFDEVVLSVERSGVILRVSVVALPVYSDATDDLRSDIGNLGMVIKRLIEVNRNINQRKKNDKRNQQTSIKKKMLKLIGQSDCEDI